jgi:hypothetical protein
MGELGEVLELLHGAGDRWRTARLTIRDWLHHERARVAHERRRQSGAAHQMTLYAHRGAPEPEHESVVRVWLDGDRAREERADGLAIRHGDRWWLWSEAFGARTNDGDPRHLAGIGDVALRLLEPSHVLAALRLELAGETEAVGRSALRVVARERDARRETGMLLFQLGYGADAYELLVDRERGVLLRTAALLDREPFAVTEVGDLAFDETFPPETFVFELPEGESFREDVSGRRSTLESAAAAAPFTVLAPAAVPEGWRLVVISIPASDRPPTPDVVVLHYHSPDAAHSLSIHECAADAADQHEWIVWEERDGVGVAAPDTVGGWARVVRHGTRAVLHSSDVELDDLLAFAAALRPAPTEPPSFS